MDSLNCLEAYESWSRDFVGQSKVVGLKGWPNGSGCCQTVVVVG